MARAVSGGTQSRSISYADSQGRRDGLSSQRRDAALDIERWICAFMDEHIVPFRRDQGHSNAVLDKLLAAIGKLGSGWLQAALALPFD